jgi:dTMP kinase
MPRAPFITFEGIEGAGKTTLAHHLADWLRAQGVPVRLTREPGGSALGAQVRPILLNEPLDAWAELFLFLADRRQHTLQIILPALEQGVWVLCDRYADSTLVYQGYGRGLDIALIRRLNAHRNERPHARPDCADRPACGGRPRPRERAQPLRSRDTLAFHTRIREGYLQLARAEPHRFLVLNGLQPLETLKQSLLQVVQRFLDG